MHMHSLVQWGFLLSAAVRSIPNCISYDTIPLMSRAFLFVVWVLYNACFLRQAGRSKRQRAMVALEPGDTISANVVLAKPEAKWAVAASKDGRLLVVQVADFHCPHRTCQDAGLCFDANVDQDSMAVTAPSLSEGKEFVAKVGESFTHGLEGYWEAQEDGAGASGCNPYAGAVLVVEEGAGSASKRKVSVGCVMSSALIVLLFSCVPRCMCC